MDDLISRQGAIDAFDCTNELIVGGEANARNVANYINKVIGKIKDLPSAQPEIIMCNSCRHDNNCEIQYAAQAGSKFFCGYGERREE